MDLFVNVIWSKEDKADEVEAAEAISEDNKLRGRGGELTIVIKRGPDGGKLGSVNGVSFIHAGWVYCKNLVDCRAVEGGTNASGLRVRVNFA